MALKKQHAIGRSTTLWGVAWSFRYPVFMVLPTLITIAIFTYRESVLLHRTTQKLFSEYHCAYVSRTSSIQNHYAFLNSSVENHQIVHEHTHSAQADHAFDLYSSSVKSTSTAHDHDGHAFLNFSSLENRVNSSRTSTHDRAILVSSSVVENHQNKSNSTDHGHAFLKISSVENHGHTLEKPTTLNYTDLVSTCNFFSGKWVFDKNSPPQYTDSSCSFMIDDLACEKYGRKDLNYQYWRWQPHDCDLPKFDAKAFLEKIRNKNLILVGDSINRNQWVSLICLVESAIRSGYKSRHHEGNMYSFTAKEYNAKIQFYWSPLLVESNSDDPSHHHLDDRIMKIRSIKKHAKHWTDADILVFNSHLWWKNAPMRVVQGSFEDPNPIYKPIEYRKSYKMALNTWSNWVVKHVNSSKTRMFWMSMSAGHTRSDYWGKEGKRRCFDETKPARKKQLLQTETDPDMMRLTEGAIENIKTKGFNMAMLNITLLSTYRKDAHPTIYKKLWRPLTKQQLANPLLWADCTHWCLPGVPDVWNQILYAYIMS